MKRNRKEGPTAYQIEKFIPTRCPNPRCRNEFQRSGRGEGGFLLFLFWKGESSEEIQNIIASIRCPGLATDLICCGMCESAVMRVVLETRVYKRRSDAEAALRDGFTNLLEIETISGNPPEIEILRHSHIEAREPKRYLRFTERGVEEFS